MSALDTFLKLISRRYPDNAKLNRVMTTVGRDIERRAPQVNAGVPGAEKMFDQRDALYGRLLDKKNAIEGEGMNPALLTFLKKMGSKAIEPQNLALGAGAAGVGALGAYGGHRATMNALPESLLESLGLPGDMAEDITGSIEDAYGYAEKHPIAAAALLAPAGYGLSRAGGDIGQKINSMGEGLMEERRRRKKR